MKTLVSEPMKRRRKVVILSEEQRLRLAGYLKKALLKEGINQKDLVARLIASNSEFIPNETLISEVVNAKTDLTYQELSCIAKNLGLQLTALIPDPEILSVLTAWKIRQQNAAEEAMLKTTKSDTTDAPRKEQIIASIGDFGLKKSEIADLLYIRYQSLPDKERRAYLWETISMYDPRLIGSVQSWVLNANGGMKKLIDSIGEVVT